MKSLKQVISVLAAIAKAKSTAVRSKTSAIKTRLTLYKFLHDKKVLMSVVSQKTHAVNVDNAKLKEAFVSYKPTHNELVEPVLEEKEEEEYPWNTNTILESGIMEEDGDEFDSGPGSVIDFICSQEHGPDFSSENEIDKAADVFIRRFHRQMQIQKQESFKRYQEMLERSL